MPDAANPPLDAFITRWQTSGAAERANYQLFLSELCDLLAVPRPDPTRADERDNAYVFEKAVTFSEPDGSHTTGRIDLYKRACFVLEAKQGSDAVVEEAPLFTTTNPLFDSSRTRRGTAGWDAAMVKARNQADRYVHVGFGCLN